MPLLTARSRRFSRSCEYRLPESRPTSPTGYKTRIQVVVPATHNRAPENKGGRTEERK